MEQFVEDNDTSDGNAMTVILPDPEHDSPTLNMRWISMSGKLARTSRRCLPKQLGSKTVPTPEGLNWGRVLYPI